MLTPKRLLILLAICVIAIPIGLFTFAQQSVTIETSDGQTVTITNAAQAHREWNTAENDLGGYLINMATLVNERDAIQYSIDRNTSSLDDMAKGLGLAAILGKRPDVAAVMLFAAELLEDMNNNIKNYKLKLKLIDKYVEIQIKNSEIANAYSDRDKYHAALATFEGYEREKSNKGSLSSMQQSIPPLGAACAGGGCGDWYYDETYYEFYHGQTLSGRYGTPVPLSSVREYAERHLTTCDGCSDEYWSCVDSQEREHEVLYCSKSIEYYMYDSLSGNWDWISVGTCGDTYRRCDSPTKKISHRYQAVMLGGTDSYGNWGYYVSSYQGATATAHGSGTTTKPSVSINGPNGVGVSSHRIDKTPNCSVCMDGSSFCPNASSSHSNSNSANEQADNTPQTQTPEPPQMHPCGVHATSVSGNHDRVTPACGVSAHAGYACQISSDHKNPVNCPQDSFNNNCDYLTYYPCSPHEHSYPPPTTPMTTCANGHSYDPNNPSENNRHRTRTCRFSECGQTWEACGSSNAPICNKPYRNRNGLRCWAIE